MTDKEKLNEIKALMKPIIKYIRLDDDYASAKNQKERGKILESAPVVLNEMINNLEKIQNLLK